MNSDGNNFALKKREYEYNLKLNDTVDLCK